MSTLAHVFEAAGLTTIVYASMLEVVQKMNPPRALYSEFPLGRPLGKPGDAEFQRQVLQAGLDLLAATEPVIETFPEVIEADETPMSCAIPPRYDPDLPAGGRRGTRRCGRPTTVRWPAGASPRSAARSRRIRSPMRSPCSTSGPRAPRGRRCRCQVAIRSPSAWTSATYYEEAALQLVDGPTPSGRSAEAWFHESTEAGRTLMTARKHLKDQGAPFPLWFYMAPAHR